MCCYRALNFQEHYAKDEDQVGREKAIQSNRKRAFEARKGVPGSHYDFEVEEAQTRPAQGDTRRARECEEYSNSTRAINFSDERSSGCSERPQASSTILFAGGPHRKMGIQMLRERHIQN
jgi:hypothetical protein